MKFNDDDLFQFHTGTVLWFDPSKGMGFIRDDEPDRDDVRIISAHYSAPAMDDGMAGPWLDVFPRKGDRVVFWVSQRRKGPDADHWCYLVQAVKVLRDDWIRKHDRCACGHLFAEHEKNGSCTQCICDRDSLCSCGHMPEDHEINGCMLCGCGHCGYDEYDPETDWFHNPDFHDYVEVSLPNGRTGVQVDESHESNLGDSAGGFTIHE